MHLCSAVPMQCPKTKVTREHLAGRCSCIGRQAGKQAGRQAGRQASRQAVVERGCGPAVISEDVAEIGSVSVDVRHARPVATTAGWLQRPGRPPRTEWRTSGRRDAGRGGGRAQAGRGGAPTGAGQQADKQTEQFLRSTGRPVRWRGQPRGAQSG